MAQRALQLRPDRKQLLVLALMAAAVYVLLPQMGDFRSSWHLLGGADTTYVLLAVALTSGTFVAGAGTYCLLAFRPLRYGRTLVVQLAATFVNRLLPAGIGALGANYMYLRQERHTAAQAAGVVAMNNLLGIVGHTLLVGLTLSIFTDRSSFMAWQGPGLAGALKVVAVIVAVIVLSLVFVGRRKLARGVSGLGTQILRYRDRPWHLVAGLATSLVLTLCNTFCLYFCLEALGLHPGFTAVLVVFTLGLGAGSIVPTPGGLGGFEAGLAAGLVGWGIGAAPALASALLYRLVSYWLPMMVGAVAFVWFDRRGYLRSLSG